MTVWTIALGLALAAADSRPPAGADTAGTPAVAPRRYHQIENDMSAALRAETHAKTPEARAAAVRKLCELYGELTADPRLEASDVLKSYRAKLWSRMTRIKRELEQRLARQSGGPSGRAPSEAEAQAIQDAATSLASQMSYSSYTLGGPSYVLAHSGAAFGGGTVSDHAQELIDLIQRTISPQSWDVNGGQGSMFYYRPLMALVVRTTSEVHGDVGGLLEALRRAGQ
jgi:hypothetical protein